MWSLLKTAASQIPRHLPELSAQSVSSYTRIKTYIKVLSKVWLTLFIGTWRRVKCIRTNKVARTSTLASDCVSMCSLRQSCVHECVFAFFSVWNGPRSLESLDKEPMSHRRMSQWFSSSALFPSTDHYLSSRNARAIGLSASRPSLSSDCLHVKYLPLRLHDVMFTLRCAPCWCHTQELSFIVRWCACKRHTESGHAK